MDVELLKELVAAYPGQYEVYVLDETLFPDKEAWGLGVPNVWDVFIERESPGHFPELNAMVDKANAMPALLAQLERVKIHHSDLATKLSALEDAYAALGVAAQALSKDAVYSGAGDQDMVGIEFVSDLRNALAAVRAAKGQST